MDTPEQQQPRTVEFLLTKILDGLFKADQLIDLIPTRLHLHEDETFARIGRLVNELPNPRNADMEESGYRKIRDALTCAKELSTLRQQLAEQTSGEPVAGYIKDDAGYAVTFEMDLVEKGLYAPLYTTPPSVEVLVEALRKIVNEGDFSAPEGMKHIAADALASYSKPITAEVK